MQYRSVAEAIEMYSVSGVGGCIEWSGPVNQFGYGVVTFTENGRRSSTTAHRAAWMDAHGKLSRWVYVCHKCDNRLCVNIDHLFTGTQQDNINDMIAKGRHRPRGRSKPKAGQTPRAAP